jgi:hypothetical protein
MLIKIHSMSHERESVHVSYVKAHGGRVSLKKVFAIIVGSMLVRML